MSGASETVRQSTWGRVRGRLRVRVTVRGGVWVRVRDGVRVGGGVGVRVGVRVRVRQSTFSKLGSFFSASLRFSLSALKLASKAAASHRCSSTRSSRLPC